MSRTEKRIIDGQEVEVTVCPPSRRQAASSIQRKSRNGTKQTGAKYLAREKGQIV